MWIAAEYEPITAFGLRPSNTTSSGGKSLLVPTPYAIKMALLDRLIREASEETGRTLFSLVRDQTICLRPPAFVAVNRTFQKVLRPDGKLWNSTIAQREYCFHAAHMGLCFETDASELAERLPMLLSGINYFGRKGGFMQLVEVSQPDQEYINGFINLCRPIDSSSPQLGMLQRMDDMRSDAIFEEISVFIPQRPGGDGGRRVYNIVLPYQLLYHGFNHTVYELIT
jgi:hypothetical protein